MRDGRVVVDAGTLQRPGRGVIRRCGRLVSKARRMFRKRVCHSVLKAVGIAIIPWRPARGVIRRCGRLVSKACHKRFCASVLQAAGTAVRP
jgi:hypothetical protein